MIVLVTSALIPENFELRKTQYLKSIDALSKFVEKKDIQIVECFSSGDTFFSDLNLNVFISNGDNRFKNKGVKECNCLKNFLSNSEYIDSNELIIKLTGRYEIINNSFFQELKNYKGYDFYGKLMDNNSQLFTGFFAINKKILYDFLGSIDILEMEKRMINFEFLLKKYIDSNNINSHFITNLGLRALIYGEGIIDEHIL